MKKSVFRSIVLPLLLAICGVFSSGGVFANELYIYAAINDAFPPPKLIIKTEVGKALPVTSPPLFKSGHGYLQNSKVGVVTGSHFDTNYTALSVSAIKS